MIKIRRGKCPKVLVGSPKKGTHYNKKKVVKELWEMQKHKCCYCEMEIPPEGHLKAVEHFNPQSKNKRKRNDWNNLLLACAQCNGRKSNKFPTILAKNNKVNVLNLYRTKKISPLLIDPSYNRVNPEKHISFVVDDRDVETYGLPISKTKRGRITISIIGLDNSFYFDRRREWHRTLRDAYTNLLLAKDHNNPDDLRTYCDRFNQYMSARNKFAAYTREFVKQNKLEKHFPTIKIKTGYEV